MKYLIISSVEAKRELYFCVFCHVLLVVLVNGVPQLNYD